MNPAELIEARLALGRKWCEEHGVEYPPTKMEDILAIRALPEWKTPDLNSEKQSVVVAHDAMVEAMTDADLAVHQTDCACGDWYQRQRKEGE